MRVGDKAAESLELTSLGGVEELETFQNVMRSFRVW